MMRIGVRVFGVCLVASLAGCGDKAPADAVEVRTSALSTEPATLTKDTFVNSAEPNNNNGASPSIFTGQSDEGGLMRGLIQFDLPPTQQGRAQVSGVRIALTTRAFDDGSPPTPATLTLRAVTAFWGEGGGAIPQPGDPEVGRVCQPGEATWNSRACLGSSWVLTSTDLASAEVPPTADAPVTFDAVGGTPLAAVVQGWLEDRTTNQGLWIYSSTEAGPPGAAQRFYSKEAVVHKATMSVDIGCKPGFEETAPLTCTACTQAAKASCQVAPGTNSNTCNDSGLPTPTYTCTCQAPFKLGPGGVSCVPSCEPGASNPCGGNGDAAAVCNDNATGYTCACSAGFFFTGTSCVPVCGAPDPCGAGGTCSPATDHWSCACSAGFVSRGDPFPTCVDQNGCQPNHCGEGGDPGAACIDLPAPAIGYNCACTSGFAFNGTTCASSSSSSCDGQLASCQASLATSQTSLASCQTDLAASAASLAASQASAAGCQAGLVGCQAALTAGAASLAASQSSLATCQTGLASCQTNLAMSAQSLNACTSNLESCNAARDGQVAALASCQSTNASLQAGLGACQTNLTACQTIGLDTDRDGIPDRLDRCPATPAGTAVDPTGCSLAQFCALVDASTPHGIALCLAVDWQNDEPIGPALDCKVSVSQGQKSCVPNL